MHDFFDWFYSFIEGFNDQKVFLTEFYEIPAVPYQFSFQEPATPVMNGLLDLHDYVFFFIIVILSVVFLALFQVVATFSVKEMYHFTREEESSFFDIRGIFYLFVWFFVSIKGLFALRTTDFIRSSLKKEKIFPFPSLSSISSEKTRYFLRDVSVNKFFTLNIFSFNKAVPNASVFSEEDSNKDLLSFSLSQVVSHAQKLLEKQDKDFRVLKVPSIFCNIFLLLCVLNIQDEFRTDSNKLGYIVHKLGILFPISFSFLRNTLRNSEKFLQDLDSNELYIYEDDFFDMFFLNFGEFTSVAVTDDSFFFSNVLTDITFSDLLSFDNEDTIELSSIIQEDEDIFDYTDLVRNFDFVLPINKVHNEALCLNNLTSALVESFILDEIIASHEDIFDSWSFDVVETDFSEELVISPHNEKDDTTIFSDLDIDFISEVILSNIVHHIYCSKFKQRFELLEYFFMCDEPIFFNEGRFDDEELLFCRDDIIEEEDICENTDNFTSNSNQKISNLENIPFLSLVVGDFYLTNFLTSCFVRLHQFLKIGYFNHSTRLEIVWTLIPIAIIALIITPSFFFMYAIDEDMESLLTVRVIGHQWFWSYIYSFPSQEFFIHDHLQANTNRFFDNLLELRNFSFDSYMSDDLTSGLPRLLATDSVLFLPKHAHINCIVTSSDVLHSWALPSLGVKIDAVPGRLNRVDIFIEHEGVFFGQCSELCGVNHAFMPIQIEAVSLAEFFDHILAVFH